MRTPTSTTNTKNPSVSRAGRPKLCPCLSRQQRGFTLTEVLAVLFILSLAALLVGPRLSLSSAQWDMRRDGQKVASLVRETRLLAITAGEPQTITFHPANATISSPKDAITLNGATISTVTAEEMDSDEGLPQIVYFPDGSASGGRVSITKHGTRYTVGVDWLTGIVETRWEEVP